VSRDNSAQLIAINCDVCSEDITGEYFPGVTRCDNCADRFGDAEPETYAEFCDGAKGDAGDIFADDIGAESLTDCLQDIASGAGFDSLGFWKADSPV